MYSRLRTRNWTYEDQEKPASFQMPHCGADFFVFLEEQYLTWLGSTYSGFRASNYDAPGVVSRTRDVAAVYVFL